MLSAADPTPQPTIRKGLSTFTQRVAQVSGMEVEIKLALPDANAHAKVLKALASHRRTLHRQQNYFFDSPDGAVSRSRRSLRVRLYDDDKAVLTIKGRLEMKGGIARATELEDELDVGLAKRAVKAPQELLSCDNASLKELRKEVKFESLVCLGTFKNNRTVFDWQGQVVEVDETIYSATASHPTEATFYEIELETEEPETIKTMLTDFLDENKISWADNNTTKFKRFRDRAKIVEAADERSD